MSWFQKIFASTILFFNMYAIAFAHDATVDLTALLLNIHTMQADFTQTVTDKTKGKSLQQTQGHMALERPGKFRWDVTKPIAQLIIANGQKLWIYDTDLEQVTIKSFQSAAGQTPAVLLSASTLTLSKDFNVKVQADAMQVAGHQMFLLTPKESEDPFETIRLSFINKQIHEMRLEDRLGHITTIAFQNVKVGMPLAGKLFTFKPSANIDVIDETKNPHKS